MYPTKSQISCLKHTLEICRRVYNDTLALRRDSWENENKVVSLFETNKQLTQLKQISPELKLVHSQVLQNVQVRVDLAFKSFFRRCKLGEIPGYPRFKQFGRYDSITYPQAGWKFGNASITLSKIGKIKTVFHRPLEGTVKTVTVRRTPTQKWYVSIVCEDIPAHALPISEECVGIDVGLKTFAMLSNGESIPNPRFYRKEEKNLAKAQRKGVRKVVARVHERIANKREDFTQKLSRDLANRYGTICFEDLNIRNMLRNHNLAKSISDASWGKLVQYTTYKAEDAGRSVVLVNPRNTSQMCSCCGQIVSKDISVRIHDCPHCGYRADRDLNAAINIMRLGLQSLAKA